jgi:hypothetical protein
VTYDRRNYQHKWRIERQTAALRAQLGLDQLDVLDPVSVVHHLDAELFTLADLALDDVALARLRRVGFDGLATTHPTLGRAIIIINCGKPKRRQTATLAEELAHLILGHKPSQLVLVPELGIRKRTFDPSQEHEAYDYGAAMVLPKERIQRDVKELQLRATDIADTHSCSRELVEYRIRRMALWKRYQGYAAPA